MINSVVFNEKYEWFIKTLLLIIVNMKCNK